MIKKYGLYRFLTTFCLVPVTDWAALAQRVVGMIERALIISGILKLIHFAMGIFSTPFYVVGICALLTWSPDTVAWIFIKIGEIQMQAFMIVLNVAMPDIFAAGDGSYRSWSDIWQQGLNLLPTEILEIINGLGVAELWGIITGTFGSIWVIKIYRKIMMRAGLF